MQQDGEKARTWLLDSAPEQLQLYAQTGSGRIVHEIGAAIAEIEGLDDEDLEMQTMRPVQECVRLYKEWRGGARRPVLCWIWLSRMLGVAKDIRLLIADMIWQDRLIWCER